MINVTLFVRADCPGCDQVRQDLADLQAEVPHRLLVVDVERDAALKSAYEQSAPVVQVGPYYLHAPISRQELLVALGAARDRAERLTQEDPEAYAKRLQKGRTFSGSDRFSYLLGNHYMLLFNLIVALYVGMPFVAPMLAKGGYSGVAGVVYKVYSPFCHQMAFRSWFLFGEQAYYPRALAGLSVPLTYEDIANVQQVGTQEALDARNFIGNEAVGYKVALCERDVAIYGALLIFGLLFAATGRRWKSFPWYIWIVVGLVPIGLDGVSQIPSLMEHMPAWMLMRESTPFLRTFTGGLFGWMTAWYLYPLIEEAMQETRRILAKKMAVAEQLAQQTPEA